MQEPSSINKLNRSDRQILKLLQADGRLTNADLAKKIYSSTGPAIEKCSD